MKSILLTKKVLSLVLLAIVVLATGCIKDDLAECSKLTLKAVNYKNEEITSGGSVKDVTLYVFDEEHKYLETVQLDKDFIVSKKDIVLNYPEGTKLTLVAYGNLSGGSQDIQVGTKAEDLFVSLKTQEGLAQSPDSLFYGSKKVETVGSGGYVGGNQEIVIVPRTGTVTMSTTNLDKAIIKKGLKASATGMYQFQVDKMVKSLDYTGAQTGDTVFYQPEGKSSKLEWVTTEHTMMYDDQNLSGTIYDADGAPIETVHEATNEEEGTVGPITILTQRNIHVNFRWGEDGAFLGARIRVTPWGVVDDDIEW